MNLDADSKRCNRCGDVYPLEKFYLHKDRSGGTTRRGTCSYCEVEKTTARYTAHPAKRRRNTLVSRARRIAALRVANDHPKIFARYVAEERAKLGIGDEGDG